MSTPTDALLVPQEGRWCPIETAPKDGRPLWLIADGATIGLTIPHQFVGFWHPDYRYAAGGAWHEAARDFVHQPTNWMPLPAPPAAPPAARPEESDHEQPEQSGVQQLAAPGGAGAAPDRGRPAVTELEEKVAAVTKLDEQLNAKKEAEGLSTLRRRLSELDPPPAAGHRHIWTLVGGQTEPTCIRCGVTRREHDGGAEPWSEVPLDTNHIALRYRSGPAEASANDVPALLKALSATRAELSRLTEARDRLQSRVDDLEGRIGCN